MQLTERYSCGHPRIEKYKHVCPACRAQRAAASKAEYRAQHVSQRAISEQRKKAALARIDTLLSLAKNLTLSQIGRQLGISKQRVHQLLRWRDKQLEKAKTG